MRERTWRERKACVFSKKGFMDFAEIDKWKIPVQASKTARSDGDLEDIAQDYESAMLDVREVYELLVKAGKLIDYLAFVIRMCQAPGMDQRLDIRWWWVSRRRSPVLVRWKQEGSKFASRRVLRLTDEMVVRVTVEELRPVLKGCLDVMPQLFAVWDALRKSLTLRTFPRGHVRRHKFRERLEELADKITDLHVEVQRERDRRGARMERRFRIEEVLP